MSLKKKILIAVGVCLVARAAWAANISIPFTAGQNTYVQTVTIPAQNARACAQFRQAPNCTSANLVAGGCVAIPFSSVNKQNLTFQACTIYTQDAAGEAAYDADYLYNALVAQVRIDQQTDYQLSKAAWLAANQAARDTACVAVGRPAGCVLVVP